MRKIIKKDCVLLEVDGFAGEKKITWGLWWKDEDYLKALQSERTTQHEKSN